MHLLTLASLPCLTGSSLYEPQPFSFLPCLLQRPSPHLQGLPMSQVITSTVSQKETIMVDSPMHLDDPEDQGSSPASKLSPDQPPPPPPLPSLSMLRRLPVPGSMANGAAARQAASESEKSSENATDASNSDKAESVTNDEGVSGEGGPEDHICVCAPPVQRVPRPANCEFSCTLRTVHCRMKASRLFLLESFSASCFSSCLWRS